MDMRRFVIYTFVGSFPWCLGLAYLGMKLGDHWDSLGKYFHRFDAAIGAHVVVGIVLYVWRHLRRRPA